MVVDASRGTSDPFCMVVLQESPLRPNTEAEVTGPVPQFTVGNETFFITGGAQVGDAFEEAGGTLPDPPPEPKLANRGGRGSLPGSGTRATVEGTQRGGSRPPSWRDQAGSSARSNRSQSANSSGKRSASQVSVLMGDTDIADPANLLAM